MTAAQALIGGRAGPVQAPSRGASFREQGLGEGADDVAFEDVMHGAAKEEQPVASARQAPGERRPDLDQLADGSDAAGESVEESAVIEQQSTGSNALVQVFATFMGGPAEALSSSPAAEALETAEDVLSRLLEQTLPEAGQEAAAGDGADLDEIKAAVEATDVSVRGQEKHLAPVKPSGQFGELDAGNNIKVVDETSPDAAAQAAQLAQAQMAIKAPEGKTDSGAQSAARASDLSSLVETLSAASDTGSEDQGQDSSHGGGAAGSSNGGAAALMSGGAPALQGSSRAEGIDTFVSLMREASPASQVAARVTTEMGGADIGGAAVKVLHLELKPENLGTVTVRVSLKDEVISLHMEAQRPETALAIEREREALSAALKQAGYIVDQVTMQQADPRVSRIEGAQSASSGSMSSQGQASGQGFDQAAANSGGGGGQRGQQSERGAVQAPQVNDGRTVPLSGGNSGTLYV